MKRPDYECDWAKIWTVDALDGAKLLTPQSVNTIVTSPPYWSLRSYLPYDHPDKPREIGAEETPEAWVENLVKVFRSLNTALHYSGTLWVVVGDTYANNKVGSRWLRKTVPRGYKQKDLIGLPFMLAFALRSAGWYWRSNTVWCKRSAMPENVRDRPSVATEQILMFSKNARYFFDHASVRESAITFGDSRHLRTDNTQIRGRDSDDLRKKTGNPTTGRNIRNWWVINPRPYPRSHYATYPVDLVYPMVKAGTSEYGVCATCFAPWQRAKGQGVAWSPTCSCESETMPATVLDPFMGSGTTALAARSLGRRSVGFDLDKRSIALIEERMGTQEVLL